MSLIKMALSGRWSQLWDSVEEAALNMSREHQNKRHWIYLWGTPRILDLSCKHNNNIIKLGIENVKGRHLWGFQFHWSALLAVFRPEWPLTWTLARNTFYEHVFFILIMKVEWAEMNIILIKVLNVNTLSGTF